MRTFLSEVLLCMWIITPIIIQPQKKQKAETIEINIDLTKYYKRDVYQICSNPAILYDSDEVPHQITGRVNIFIHSVSKIETKNNHTDVNRRIVIHGGRDGLLLKKSQFNNRKKYKKAIERIDCGFSETVDNMGKFIRISRTQAYPIDSIKRMIKTRDKNGNTLYIIILSNKTVIERVKSVFAERLWIYFNKLTELNTNAERVAYHKKYKRCLNFDKGSDRHDKNECECEDYK